MAEELCNNAARHGGYGTAVAVGYRSEDRLTFGCLCLSISIFLLGSIRSAQIKFYQQDSVVHYLDLSDEFVVLVILCVRELINFYFVLLYLFHYLTKKTAE